MNTLPLRFFTVVCLCVVVRAQLRTTEAMAEPASSFAKRFAAFPYGFLFVRPAGNQWLPGRFSPPNAYEEGQGTYQLPLQQQGSSHRVLRRLLPMIGPSPPRTSWRSALTSSMAKRSPHPGYENGLTLSVTAPLDLLREKMQMDLRRRRVLLQRIEAQNSQQSLRNLG
ncbi:hypothetical protein BV898_01063 [Hypsibius exemplaris]|uniref:Corticotropin-releasing factor domain-containing protein n=1 Tax=Hypsibius exemplaris TaxID=2072580 RepID=A0A1W0XD24_HYPEX|nr:hypothetical protein BV898_01063 [Hypsibius exemplaris]